VDRGMRIGYWALGQTTKPQSPIPNPQSPIEKLIFLNLIIY